MNYKALLHYLGLVLRLEAVFLLAPLAVALGCGEMDTARAFGVSAGVILLAGILLGLGPRQGRQVRPREGFVVVAVCWVAIAVTGALPYWLSGEIGSFGDCLFESISGFTTTAASVVADVEGLSKGLLFWRSLSLWIGGMGVLVLLVAVTPFLSGEHPQLVMRAESPGPSPGKLTPKLRHSASILYGIYLGLTALQVVMMSAGGMPFFDSLITAMATAGTGGFTATNASIAGYDSLYLEVVIMVFMFLGGLNFNIHYFLLTRNFRGVARSDELKAYGGLLAAAALLVAADLARTGYGGWGLSLRHGAFQVVSIATTTGFTTADIGQWPHFSKTILFLLMLTGACAGSSAGGLKIARLVVLAKEARRVLHRMLRPNGVEAVKLDGKVVSPRVVYEVSSYFGVYFVIYLASVLLVSVDQYDFETTLTSVAACLNNVGAGLGMLSEAGRISEFSGLSKTVLAMDMLLGRLEIYPVLLLLSPRSWRRV